MILSLENVEVSYAKKKVLHGISLSVGNEEIVALIGHNGAGKTTLLKAVLGLLKVDAGKVLFRGKEVTNQDPYWNVREGIVYCPQGGEAFPRLTVSENLEVAGNALGNGEPVRKKMVQVFDLFPALLVRRNFKAGVLSGGERQMLAIGIALMLSPKLFLIDEPSGGLSPMYVDRVFEAILKINRTTRTPIFLVEQNIKHALDLATTVYVLRNGQVVFRGTPSEVKEVMGEKFFGF